MTETAPRGEVRRPAELPEKQHRSRRGKGARESFSLEIETVTPILGGAPKPRTVDRIDVIRAPTIRGHLRFWWRALYGTQHETPKALFDAESALWGKAADNKGGRSEVDIAVELISADPTQIDRNDPAINSPSGYALFPARKTGDGRLSTAPRRRPGIRFRLSISVPSHADTAVRNAVRAWVLFGGYGSRTRRGVGSLGIAGDEDEQCEWLPELDRPNNPVGRRQLRQELTRLFGADLFAPPPSNIGLTSFPALAGAILLVGDFQDSASSAWTSALGWLRDFRQAEGVARDQGTAPDRPGRSRWPEPDKLRQMFKTHSTLHQPRYGAEPSWPRALFGLPILGQFSEARGKGEPPPFELAWQNEKGELQDRLASQLIVKPLPVVGGFFPCALWLSRADPPGRVVVLRQGNRNTVVPGSAASFRAGLSASDKAVAQSLSSPWDGNPGIRNAFLNTVIRTWRGTRVAP